MKVAVAAGLVSTVLAGVLGERRRERSDEESQLGDGQSAKAGGGMTALVKAAQEGRSRQRRSPSRSRAGRTTALIMKDFTKKYGIKINDANPNGSSAQEITAIQQDKGRADAPDVVDVGTRYATSNLGTVGPVQGRDLEPDSRRPEGPEGSLV